MKFCQSILAGVALALLSACAGLGLSANQPISPETSWVASSSGWKEEAQLTFSEASQFVREQSRVRADGSWAVILDVDETVLNNVDYQISRERRGEEYTPESWFAWTQKESATLVPGATMFIADVNALGGHVALVTNRRDREQLATENNLAVLGLERGKDFRVLLTRASPEGAREKDGRFAIVDELLGAQGYPGVTVIAYLGDAKGDKPDAVGAWKFFCVDQGGMYGDPCARVPGPGR